MAVNNKNKKELNISMQNKKLEEIDSYRYLGSLITNDGRNLKEVKNSNGKISLLGV